MEMFCVSDFEEHARKVLPKNAWDYYSSGANQEQSLRDNVDAFSRYRFRPRMLHDVSKIDLRVQLLGEWVESPVGVAPTAMQKMAHPVGEVGTAQASAGAGACMTLSSWSTTSMEEVAAACGHRGLRWFQLYLYKNPKVTTDLIKRAERAGYKALVVTVDTPILGRRLADARNKFNLPPYLSLANFNALQNDSKAATELVMKTHDSGLHQYTKELIDDSLDWGRVDWLCGLTRLPVILKGILTGEDAKEATRHGVKGIVVSNHGARQLDGVPATIDVLAEVVSAVRGSEVEVYLDGGVRQGTDVLKALAMGARAVFVGRPVLWGLAYAGREGVEQVLHMLTEELTLAMQLAGCSSVADIPRNLVVHESYFKLPKAKL